MRVSTVSDIITKTILNENTGELERQDFQQVKQTKRVRGGFRMVYKAYDKVVESIIRSQKDFSMLVYIRDLFTYNKIERAIIAIDIANHFGVSRQKATTFIKKMVEAKLLMKVSKSEYRLNPFMYLPFRSDAELLQKEWSELLKDEK